MKSTVERLVLSCLSVVAVLTFLHHPFLVHSEKIWQNVCFNHSVGNTSITFVLQSPKTVVKAIFPVNISHELIKKRYSYDTINWYSVSMSQDISTTLVINLFGKSFDLVLRTNSSGYVGCLNMTIEVVNEERQPNLTFSELTYSLNDKQKVPLIVKGQFAGDPICYLINKDKVLHVSKESITVDRDLVKSHYSLNISRKEIYNILCDTCIMHQCKFPVTCEVSYSRGLNSTKRTLTVNTTIYASQLSNVNLTLSPTTAHFTGMISNNECNATKAIISIKNETHIFPILANKFVFELNLPPCSVENATMQTFTSSNISSETFTNIALQAQPDFSHVLLSSSGESAVNVSWDNVTCLGSYSIVQVEYKIDIDFEYTSKNVSSDRRYTVLSNLFPSTSYEIRIRFNSGSIKSVWSKVYKISTPNDVPVLPGPLITTSLNNFLNLSWMYANGSASYINFTISINSSRPYDPSYPSKLMEYFTDELNIEDRAYAIEFGTIYTISIIASNARGFSRPYNKSIVTPSNVQTDGPLPEKTELIQVSSSGVKLRLKEVRNANGPISFYDVIVSKNTSFTPKTNNFFNYSTSNAKNLSYYITLRLKFINFRDVTVGDDTKMGEFANVPLNPSTSYKIFVRYGSQWNNELQFNPYNDSNALIFRTNEIEETDPSLSTGVKAAIIVSAIGVVFVSFFIWICYNLHKHKNHESIESTKDYNSTFPRKQSNVSTGQVNMGYELDYVSGNTLLGYQPLKYDVDEKIPPVPATEFPNYVTQIKTEFDIQRQFNQLRDGKEFASNNGKDPSNGSRNRYEDIRPYDHNRFILEAEKKSSDYINASLVSSYARKDAYVATQGPLPSTFNDFWKMVWQCDSRTIVVLGQRIESGIIKYALYWPTAPNVEMKYGKIFAKMKVCDKRNGYTATTISIYKKSQPGARIIKLFHFSAWPDREAPNKTKELLSLRKAVCEWRNGTKGPTIVHCSAGVGRTGAFIAIDAIIENISRTQTIDVYNYVNYLRTRRMYMVQTQAQYMFIHDAILEHLLGQSTEVEVNKSNIERVIKELSQVDPKNNMDGFTKNFLKLNRLSVMVQQPQDLEGLKEEHTQKNRDPMKVPLDSYRVRLVPAGLTLSETYINATQVNNRLVSTQAPLESTCKDFWMMIYEFGIKNVVMVNGRQEGSDIFTDYFSVAETTTHGPLYVTVVSEISPIDFVVKRELVLKHDNSTEDEMLLTHYQVLNWPRHSMPESNVPIIYVINELLRSNASEPTVVHCDDGFDRSGCLLACLLTVERLDENEYVIIDDVVKMLHERNPEYICSVSQYEFIFNFLREYLMARYNGVTYI